MHEGKNTSIMITLKKPTAERPHATPPPSLMPQHKRHEHRLQRLGTNGVF